MQCCPGLAFQPISRAEYPPHQRQTHGDKTQQRAQADSDVDVASAEEAPAEARDDVDDGIEQAVMRQASGSMSIG